MSHEISKVDRQQGLVMAWHKLTEIVKEIVLKTCWLAQWDVKKENLFRADGSKSEYCELVCTDDSKIKIQSVPVHCETYVPITNAKFLEVVDEAIKGIRGAKIASVGSVCQRGRIFVSVSLSELPAFKAAGREFDAYLNFGTSHDQSCMFFVNTSNTCTVCNNTFSMNLNSTKSNRSNVNADGSRKQLAMRAKHTKNVITRIDNVSGIVDSFLGAQAEFKAIMDTLHAKPIESLSARGFFAGFLASSEEIATVTRGEKLELSTRKENQIDRLHELFRSGAGNNGRDLSDVFSAVSDYYSHESSGRDVDPMKQFEASEFGAGATAKTRAWNILKDTDQTRQLIQTGNAVLALS